MFQHIFLDAQSSLAPSPASPSVHCLSLTLSDKSFAAIQLVPDTPDQGYTECSSLVTWGYKVADMKVGHEGGHLDKVADMVAEMEVNKVTEMVANMNVDKVADMVATWWPTWR